MHLRIFKHEIETWIVKRKAQCKTTTKVQFLFHYKSKPKPGNLGFTWFWFRSDSKTAGRIRVRFTSRNRSLRGEKSKPFRFSRFRSLHPAHTEKNHPKIDQKVLKWKSPTKQTYLCRDFFLKKSRAQPTSAQKWRSKSHQKSISLFGDFLRTFWSIFFCISQYSSTSWSLFHQLNFHIFQ